MQHGEFRDDRLVTVYDVEFPWARDDDFFLSMLAEQPASDVLDLGCGTGRLAIAMAARGYRVTGVDPARLSLALAGGKSGADRVTWIEGSTEVLPAAAFDAALMTSHVAQFFVSDDEFAGALADLHRALRPGGRLIFDSRDPADRRWEKWNPTDSRHTTTLPGGSYETWVEVTSVADGAVSFDHQYVFSDGDVRMSTPPCASAPSRRYALISARRVSRWTGSMAAGTATRSATRTGSSSSSLPRRMHDTGV